MTSAQQPLPSSPPPSPSADPRPEDRTPPIAPHPARVSEDDGWRGPVVGVVGGLGPAATATFLRVVVELTRADRDQDHLDMVVLNHSTTPDRTAHILDPREPDPAPVLAADARRLQAFGVDLVVLPCNTAHQYKQAIHDAIDIPLISIVERTAEVATARSGGEPVGILATDGTRAAGVYQHAVEACGGEVILPSDEDQALITRVIYEQVKPGLPVDMPMFNGVIDRLVAAGAAKVVLGCTELSVVYAEERLHGDERLVDSLDVLARATILAAGREVRQ